MRKVIRHALSTTALAVAIAGCRRPETPSPVTEVVVATVASLPAEPGNEAWNRAPELVAHLIPQDLVDPRLMETTTGDLRVRALSDGTDVAFRLQWTDKTKDDLATPAAFADACAIQLPEKIESTLPAPQMGEEGRAVQITYWSAAWQAIVDGRGNSLEDLYPNATVDHYPFEAPSLEPGSTEQQAMAARYAPARAVGNLMAGPREKAVQDLIAEGPGTLTRASATTSDGRGERTEDGWRVVISRPAPEGFAGPAPAQIAFAVWEGSQGEVGARKMRTGWISLAKKETP